MKHNITQSWLRALEVIVKRPVILLPFLIAAFFDGLALELIYFFPRKPVSFIITPIIRKFFGETFVHYPGNLLLLPKLFYYAQVVTYIVIGVFLTAIAINMYKNIKADLPLRTNALIKNALKRYPSFLIYGVLLIALALILKKVDFFIIIKVLKVRSPFIASLFLFLTNIIMQTFLILTVPIIVVQKKSLLKAFGGSIYLAARNFFGLFILILVPFLLYLPISLLKGFSVKLVDLTFPEINLYVAGAGIVIAVFIDCFIAACTTQFLLDESAQ
jgi:hypothetical protein